MGLTEADAVRRVAMISVHTSPLDQPGTGDAGGMNVYVIELSTRLAAAGIEVDIFTRATSSRLDPIVELGDGITVRNIHAGPFEGLTKGELPGQLCVFAREVLRTEAGLPLGHYDMVHSHYWLSGQVGALARDRWGVPLVHTMHTMAKVKNDAMADGDTPEPAARIIGEEQVVEAADMLIASTDLEAKQLINLYDADPGRVEVVHPGVDLTVFRPRDTARRPRQLGLPLDAHVVLFAGRLQPLKAPDVLLRAVARAARRTTPDLRSRLVVPIVGGPRAPASSTPRRWPSWPPSCGSPTSSGSCRRCRRPSWRVWDAAASVVAVPSYNESFGLVAAEAQAAGTPVIAAAVGGLTTVVADGRQRPAARHPRARGLGPRAAAGSCSTTACAPGWPPGARTRVGRVLLGGDRRADPRHLRARARLPARAGAPVGRVGHDRPGPGAARLPDRQRPRVRGGATAASASRCRGSASSRRRSASTSGRTPSASTRSSAATPTRTTSGSTAGCSSATSRRTPSPTPSTTSATSTSTPGCRSSLVTPDELDRLLGSVLAHADGSFNTILELGFASSIRKEWEWRNLRGESTAQPRGVPRLAGNRRDARSIERALAWRHGVAVLRPAHQLRRGPAARGDRRRPRRSWVRPPRRPRA